MVTVDATRPLTFKDGDSDGASSFAGTREDGAIRDGQPRQRASAIRAPRFRAKTTQRALVRRSRLCGNAALDVLFCESATGRPSRPTQDFGHIGK